MPNNLTSSVTAPAAKLTHGRSTITRPGYLCIALALLWSVCACSATQMDNSTATAAAAVPCDTCTHAGKDASKDKNESPTAETQAQETQPQEDAQTENLTVTENPHPLPDLPEPISDRDMQTSIRRNGTHASTTKPEQKPEHAEVENGRDSTPAPSKPVAEVKHYTVKGGENLYIISRQPFIYADGMLWPLIYRANRDQIKDPRQIYPGQILNIPRDISEPDKEQARIKAKETSIFDSERPSPAEE